MKKVLVIVLCLLGTGLHAQTKTLKVISYNIWNGFDFRKDIERKNNVIDWFNDQKPDVVALQELSENADVSRKSINAIENGIYVPSTVLALKIAKTLKCKVEDLFILNR
ncbi:MAG: helix-turn-helix domain-containing protein [Flavobacteriaceae bacterium]